MSISALLQGSFEEWISSFYLIPVVLRPPMCKKWRVSRKKYLLSHEKIYLPIRKLKDHTAGFHKHWLNVTFHVPQHKSILWKM